MPKLPAWTPAALVLGFVSSAVAEDDVVQLFSSGPQRVPLVELFTSEGCSSCPPADRWMSGLRNDPGLWKDYVPISFHVDYWDYIGWTDRFATPENGQRQKIHAAAGGARTVYTPGMFVNGEEWLAWRRADLPSLAAETAGDLEMQISGNTAVVQFESANAYAGDLTVHVAILGMGLSTEVRRGENKGRTLRHDFVSLGIAKSELERSGSVYSAHIGLPDTRIRAANHAAVAWISRPGSTIALQSVGGILR